MDAPAPSWQRLYAEEEFSWIWPPAYEPNSNPRELEQILSLLEAQPGARVLDLACGLGWLTIPMALRGFQVTGYDLSAAMLAGAQESAEQTDAHIEWVRGDMRSLLANWTDTFDFVTLTLSEFGCFPDESDNQRVLAEVARVLKSGGRFLLDIVVNRDELILNGDRNNSFDGGGFLIADKGSLDLLSGIYTRVFRWDEQGRRHETTWQIRAYTAPEVKRMLEQAGFRELSAYRNYAGDALTRDSAGMVFLAQK
ncbi:MAG: methyltransferase domain-containing protein [Caldilineaceae bacterium]|nr:methyltransferase domain-containing protein [Caldilineaceae bacterium]